MVEHAVEHEGRVAVGALDRAAVERRVVVGDEGIELEHAQQIAGHASPKTTKLYDRTADTVTVDEIERIVI